MGKTDYSPGVVPVNVGEEEVLRCQDSGEVGVCPDSLGKAQGELSAAEAPGGAGDLRRGGWPAGFCPDGCRAAVGRVDDTVYGVGLVARRVAAGHVLVLSQEVIVTGSAEGVPVRGISAVLAVRISVPSSAAVAVGVDVEPFPDHPSTIGPVGFVAVGARHDEIDPRAPLGCLVGPPHEVSDTTPSGHSRYTENGIGITV